MRGSPDPDVHCNRGAWDGPCNSVDNSDLRKLKGPGLRAALIHDVHERHSQVFGPGPKFRTPSGPGLAVLCLIR